jgi:hypothetical protein
MALPIQPRGLCAFKDWYLAGVDDLAEGIEHAGRSGRGFQGEGLKNGRLKVQVGVQTALPVWRLARAVVFDPEHGDLSWL